jgi:hypothetical protein
VISYESAMRPKRALFVLFFVLGAGIPALAVTGPSPDELERNRRLLETWRADSDHYARLRRDVKAFWELTAEERERLRRLDRELHDTDARTQKRLFGVLKRYAAWVERIPEADRQQIAANDRSDRIKVIRELRDRQYLESLPSRVREELTQLPATERRTQLDRLRQEDRQLRLACSQFVLLRPEPPTKPSLPPSPRPTRLEEFPADIRHYVDYVLWRQVKPEEAEQLKKAEGAPWPLLARTILELSAKHPVKMPGPLNGPRRYVDLPSDVLKTMQPKDLLPAQRKHLNDLLGRWPEFAAEYTATARKNGVTLPRQLGPCHPKEFDPPVAQFIERTLRPKLTDAEKDELRAAEGRWPEYPRLILELSKKHGLEVPLMRLPGPREFWEQAKNG